jgi:Domain of unknown function (DUF4270)
MKKCFGFIAFIACLALPSCKENTVLSTNLIPKVDNINTFFTDTFTAVMRNVPYDSTSTSVYNNNTKYYALGCISGDASGDNIAGKSVASIALQFRQPQVGITFPSNLIIDSMVVSIPFVRAYGDTITGGNQSLDVYQLSNAPIKDTTYRIGYQMPYNSSYKLGTGTFNFKKMDSIALFEGKVAPQLRIKLDTNLARMLVNIKDTADYKSYAAFIKYFKGLYITPSDTNSGNMLGYFDYTLAKISIYTRNAIGTDSTIYAYGFDLASCVHHNKITRNHFQNSPLISDFMNSGNVKGDSILFLQSDAGSTIEVNMPYLADFNNVIVNKAELEFTVLASNNLVKDSLYRTVALMRATGINAQNVDYLLQDDYFVNSNGAIVKVVNDGFRTLETENGVKVYKYRISLTKTFQKAISSKNNALRIRLIGFNGLLGSGRSMLGGTNRFAQKAKINLIYTKIK